MNNILLKVKDLVKFGAKKKALDALVATLKEILEIIKHLNPESLRKVKDLLQNIDKIKASIESKLILISILLAINFVIAVIALVLAVVK